MGPGSCLPKVEVSTCPLGTATFPFPGPDVTMARVAKDVGAQQGWPKSPLCPRVFHPVEFWGPPLCGLGGLGSAAERRRRGEGWLGPDGAQHRRKVGQRGLFSLAKPGRSAHSSRRDRVGIGTTRSQGWGGNLLLKGN